MKKEIVAIVLAASLALSTSCTKATKNESSSEKSIITFGYTGFCEYKEEIAYFNSMQDVYEIQEREYVSDDTSNVEDINGAGSSEECREQLLADLKNGEGPDIIDLASFYLFVRDPEVNIYLEDLYPYIDSDEELNRSDFIPSFIAAYEVDGALYSTVGSLLLKAAAVSESVCQNGIWNIGMLPDTAAAAGGMENVSYMKMNSDVLFSELIGIFWGDFVDSEKKTANFTCDAYRNLLEECGKLVNEDPYTGAETNPKGVIYAADSIRSFYYPQLYKACLGGDFTFASRMDGSAAAYWSEPYNKLAMNNESDKKEGIWQFLRLFMTEEYQTEHVSSVFPANLSALNNEIADAREGVLTKAVSSPSGSDNTHIDYTPITSFDTGNIEYRAASDEDIQIIKNLIDATTTIHSETDNACIDEARRVAEQYFKGKIDLDAAVRTTQENVESILVP